MKVCPVCQREYPGGGTHCTDDGVPLVAMVADHGLRSEDLVGQIIEGRYKVERIIGKGGMGTVYACRHVVVGKVAAMKVLRTGSDRTETVLQRFVQEAKTANLLRSRHIAEVSDFGQLPSGSLFVVMELLEGQDLAHAMRKSQEDHAGLGRRELVHIFTQVAETLQLAHDKGIVHRDLKPDNVFLVREGDDPHFVKLLDFGIAKILHGDGNSAKTETGVVLGTPYYMSPEQARADNLDHRSDIYSLGVMMYRAFTGRLPFVADSTMGVLTRHITEAPQPPSQISNVDQVTEQLILRCMAKRPEYRFQSMRELCEALKYVPLGPVPALREQPTVYEGAVHPAAPSGAVAPRASSGGVPAAFPTAAATPQAVAHAASGHYAHASAPHPQAPSGPYAQAPSGPYAQAPGHDGGRPPIPPGPAGGPYAHAPSGPYAHASGPYAQAPSGPYPQAYSGPQAAAVPVVVGVAPGTASTGTMTALHPGNGPIGGEIATTRGVTAASAPVPARSNTALLLVGGLGMAAFGAAAVLFVLSRPGKAGAAAEGASVTTTAHATASPAATATASPTASPSATAMAVATASPRATASPSATATASAAAAPAPKIHGGPMPKPAATPAAPAPPKSNTDIRSPFE